MALATNCAEEKMEMTLWGAASSVLLHRVTATQNLIHRGHCSEVLEKYKNENTKIPNYKEAKNIGKSGVPADRASHPLLN